MGSRRELTVVDCHCGKSGIEPHSCSELLAQTVSVRQSSSEAEAGNVLGSDVESVANVIDGCVESSRYDVMDMCKDGLIGGCDLPNVSVLEKILEDDVEDCLRMCCGDLEFSSVGSGGLCSDENVQDEGNCDIPSEFIAVDGLRNPRVQLGGPKDVESNIFPSDLLSHTEEDGRVDQLRDRKDGYNCIEYMDEKIMDFIGEECIIDKNDLVLSSSSCWRTLESSHCDPTMLGQGNETNVDKKKTILQIDDNFRELIYSSSKISTSCSSGLPHYPESGQASVGLITNIPSTDAVDLPLKGDNGSVYFNNAAGNQGQTDKDKEVSESEHSTVSMPMPNKSSSLRIKCGSKTQSQMASKNCKSTGCLSHPDGGMKIIPEAARKKRSCFSKPARSSIWGLLGNIEQVFEQDHKPAVVKVKWQGLGKTRSTRKRGRGIKQGESSSSLSSVHECPVSATRVRLKIKVGKEDLSCSNVLSTNAADGLASASYSGSGSGSQEVARNPEGEVSQVVASRKFESFQNNLDKDALSLDGQIANSHLRSTAIKEKSDGVTEELCLVVPPERVVESLIEPINIKGMGSGTSHDSEVVKSGPEVLVEEGYREDMHLAVLGSSEEFNTHLGVSGSKGREKKAELSHSSFTQVGLLGLPRKNSATHNQNHRRKKDSCDAVSSLEFPTSTEINASTQTVISKELSMEPLPLSEEIEHGDSTETFEVKSCIEVKTTCNSYVEHRLSESHASENLLSDARSLRRKLPKSSKPSKASKVSDPPNKKMTDCSRKGKQKNLIKSEVKGKSVSDKVICEVDGRSHTVNDVGNHKLDAGDNRVSIDVSNPDLVPYVGFKKKHPSPWNAWVCCDDCHKWRRIPKVLADLIEETKCTWTCKKSKDKAFADCSIPQEKSNAEINAELGLSYASGEEDAYENSNNDKELQHRTPLVSQDSTFTCIFSNEFLHRSRKTQTIDEIMVCHCKPPPEGKLGCGDECLNRMLNIECEQGTCPCGDRCSNQQFQKRKYASLNWYKCGKKGYGLKVLEDISEGEFLIEYVGEVLDVHAYEARQRDYALKGHKHFYFMTLNGNEVIDASAKGNLGRFINHSCDPNCRTEKWMVNGEISIGLFALRDIKQDEEVTFDYNYVRVFGAAVMKCYCGSPHCRGYIGGDPLDAEVIVQGDSDEEFPEPVMLTEDNKIKDSVPTPKYFNTVSRQTTRPMLKDSCVMPTTDSRLIGTTEKEKESSMNPVSAISKIHTSVEVQDSKGKLPSSVQLEDISQQNAMESDLVEKPSSVPRSETASLITESKVLKNSINTNKESNTERVEGGHGVSLSNLLVKASQLNGSVKKGKVRANPSNGRKPEVAANRLQVSSINLKKVVEGSSDRQFEAVSAKLTELLDGDGGISKRKDGTKGYLKLLLLTVASGDRSNGEAIQSNRVLSMILDALLKTKSRTVLNDIINKNGLQMLHKIMKQYRRDFKKIPILRKVLKVLEFLAAHKILTFEHINGGPPCHGMESFRESMLYFTEHDDKQIHQIARSFRDKWIPRPFRRHGYMDRDDNRVEFQKIFNGNRFLSSHNSRHEQDIRYTETNDCVKQSTTLVDARAQEGGSATCLDGSEINGTKRRKRKSRWDQPAEANSLPVPYLLKPYPSKEQKIESGPLKHTYAVFSSVDVRQNIPENVPPGFSCTLGSLNAPLNPGNLALHNGSHPVFCSSGAVIGHPKEKFNPALPVSYGMPWSCAQQFGTPHGMFAESWISAPAMPFNQFPPPPPYPHDMKQCQPFNY
ncbi:hypothetical protein RIF29_16723 [Crotalaria pallida]|uniref:Histone-lysine N-methyltransferase ASHH2 n=1 Tax=Crotalaria pallida TaxID=3830 RepID=A0AAN9IEQ6_CROPI